MLTFEIPGDPVAKARPRAAMVAGRARLYTPAKTEKYEARVALFAQQVRERVDRARRPVGVRAEDEQARAGKQRVQGAQRPGG